MRYNNGSYFRASGTRDAFGRWSDALVAAGYPELSINDGDREEGEQEAGFRLRFRPATSASDRGPYGDRKYWPGHGYWVRVVGGGTMAVPGSSNHEKRRAADVAHPYSADTPARRFARSIAAQFGIDPEGENFEELWHWRYSGPLGAVGGLADAGNASPFPSPEEDDMPHTEQRIKELVIEALESWRVIDNRKRNLFEGVDHLPSQVWGESIKKQDAEGNWTEDRADAGGFLSSTNTQVQRIVKLLDISQMDDAELAAKAAEISAEQARRAQG